MAERSIDASLHVSNLHPNVNGALLKQIFSEAGSVLSTKVCRDDLTGASLGTAYVNFGSRTAAAKALEDLKFTKVLEKPMHIQWCQSDHSKYHSGIGNIYVKNLDKSIDDKEFNDMFKRFGPIESSIVQLDDDGVSKGFGFVQFESPESAERAIREVNGMRLKGKILYVGEFKSSEERLKEFKCIQVSNLCENFTRQQLTENFEQFGNIAGVEVKTDSQGRCQGFGFVTYVTPEEARKALKMMNGRELNGRNIVVTEAQQTQKETSERRYMI